MEHRVGCAIGQEQHDEEDHYYKLARFCIIAAVSIWLWLGRSMVDIPHHHNNKAECNPMTTVQPVSVSRWAQTIPLEAKWWIKVLVLCTMLLCCDADLVDFGSSIQRWHATSPIYNGRVCSITIACPPFDISKMERTIASEAHGRIGVLGRCAILMCCDALFYIGSSMHHRHATSPTVKPKIPVVGAYNESAVTCVGFVEEIYSRKSGIT